MQITDVRELQDWEPWVPTEGYFTDYLLYTAGIEPPLRFNFWTAATILGAVISRNLYFSRGFYNVYPNLFTMLVAPSGKCRKTTAANIGINLVRPFTHVMADKITPEQLAHRLSDRNVPLVGAEETTNGNGTHNAQAMIFAPELAVFLGKQSYNDGLVELLTRLADAPDEWTYDTRSGGSVTMHNVCISLEGCSTPDWLADAIPATAFGGGFLGRIIFVVCMDSTRRFAFPPEPSKELKQRILQHLLRASHLKGEVTISDDAREWYETWYERNRLPDFTDLRTSGYYERKQDHLIRVALLLLAAIPNSPLVLTIETLKLADEILSAIEPSMPLALSQIALSSAGRDAMRIRDQLKQNGGKMDHADLLRMNVQWITYRSFREAVSTLVEANVIYYKDELATGRTYYLVEPSTNT